MLFDYTISVPANTTERSPKVQRLKLAHGIIIGLEVQFPIGTLALTHCQLKHHSFGQLPSNPSGNFASDGYTIRQESPLEFYKPPYEVRAILWNDDDTYAHTVSIRFDIDTSAASMLASRVIQGLAKFLKIMGIKI